jgi:hypothetical protein
VNTEECEHGCEHGDVTPFEECEHGCEHGDATPFESGVRSMTERPARRRWSRRCPRTAPARSTRTPARLR